jgi:hypothetical protein
VLGTVERCAAPARGAERHLAVSLDAGRVYTVSLHTAPRGVRAFLSLYGPAGDLIGCEEGWGRVRLAQTAPATGRYTVAAEIGGGGAAFILRVRSLTSDELARAADDPLYVL